MSRSRYALFGALALVLLVGIGIALFRGKAKEEPQAEQGAKAPQVKPKEWVEVGGVRRPASDLLPAKATAPADEAKPNPHDYGRIPPTPVDLNPQVKSVAEALAGKEHPERVSALARPKAFDAKGYRADPQSYLNTIEPGRVFQPAQPGPGVQRLSPMSPLRLQVRQGESVPLKVRVVPGAPVTFTSFDVGEFSNRLTSITVAADTDGQAEAQFFGRPGTINRVNILAASPLAAGQAKFVVNVLPASAAD